MAYNDWAELLNIFLNTYRGVRDEFLTLAEKRLIPRYLPDLDCFVDIIQFSSLECRLIEIDF